VSFAVTADAYDRFMGRYSVRLSPQFADFADVRSGRAIDVGCGPGALTSELVDRLGPTHVAANDPRISRNPAAGSDMKCTTSCAQRRVECAIRNGTRSARQPNVDSGNARARRTNDSMDRSRPRESAESIHEFARERTGPATDVDRPPGTHVGKVRKLGAEPNEYLPMKRSYASAVTAKLTWRTLLFRRPLSD